MNLKITNQSDIVECVLVNRGVAAIFILLIFLSACSECGTASGDLLRTEAFDNDATPSISVQPDVLDAVDAINNVECVEDADCDDGLFCTGAEYCNEGRCISSRRETCLDTVDCTVDSCDEEADVCIFDPRDELCEPGEVCDPKAGCYTPRPCVQDDDCSDGRFCNGEERCDLELEECRPGTPPECNDDVICTIDTCIEVLRACQHVPDHTLCEPGEICSLLDDCAVASLCEEDSECEDGSFCNGSERCDVIEGRCVGGAPPTVADAIDCTRDICIEEFAEVLNVPDDRICSDQLFCNGAETCDATRGCLAGAAPVVDDEVGCTVDGCDEAGDTITHAPDDGACDDGLFCNGAEMCDVTRGCLAGAAPVVDDEVGCTVDGCDEAGDTITHAPDDGACDDGLFCNGAEMCDVTRGCLAGAAPVVDDEVGCTVDGCDEAGDTITHAPDDGACDDGLFCNGAETCDATRGCLAGAAPVVDDEVSCTVDDCDEAGDTITHAPDDGACDDGLFCNGAEMCDATRGCLAGAAPVVDDEVSCTVDGCDEAGDTITHAPDDGACDDGLFCNGAEMCDATRGCLAGAAPVVDDEVSCTVDSCDEAGDTITHAPDDGACDDGLFCNGAEMCDATRGCLAGAAPVVDDEVSCTVDSCDEAGDTITHAPDDGACEDGLFCNGAEMCDATRGCLAGAAPVVDDEVSCTVDSCDEAGDTITHAPDDGACEDNDPCTVNFCDSAGGCGESEILVCRAGDQCCPAGCTSLEDEDCGEVCGDGVVEADEACESNSDCPDSGVCRGCLCGERCDDGVDNDGDLDVDCQDIDCRDDPICPMVIWFEGLVDDDEGIVAWNANGSGPDRIGIGHILPFPFNQCRNPIAWYYLSSPDVLRSEGEGPFVEGSRGAAHGLASQTSWSLAAGLAAGGYSISDLRFSVSRMTLGDDVDGEDWSLDVENAFESRTYTGGTLTITLDGYPILTSAMPDMSLFIEYNELNNCGDEEVIAVSTPISASGMVDVSGTAPPAVQVIAQALLDDINMTANQQVRIEVSTVETVIQLDFESENGRRGAYYNMEDVRLVEVP